MVKSLANYALGLKKDESDVWTTASTEESSISLNHFMNYILNLHGKVLGNTAIKAVAHNLYFASKSFQRYQQPGEIRSFHQNSEERQSLILNMVSAPSVSHTRGPGKVADPSIKEISL